MRQRPLDLSRQPELSFATLVEGESNSAALAYLKAYPDWPSPVVLLIGPEGAGKTHMGRAFAGRYPDTLFIDDADRADEDNLFAQLNSALSGDVPSIVLASRSAPSAWGTEMPDLRSRLSNVPVFTVEEPGDDILRPILVQLFYNRGRLLGPDVVDYMLTRCPRSVSELTPIVEAIESEAQAEKADVTKTFVSRFLSRQPDLFEF